MAEEPPEAFLQSGARDMPSRRRTKRTCFRRLRRRCGSVANFRGEAAVTTWIYRVALNAAIAWTRQERKHCDGKPLLDGVELAVLQPSTTTDPRIEWLYGQIRQLSEIDRSLTLLMLDGFSYKEMAAMLGTTENYVGVKISRIKAHLTSKSKEELDHGV